MKTLSPWETAVRERLREVRLERGVSQQTLGGQVRMAHTVISQFETGARSPGLHSLLRLATELDVSLDYLTGRTDNRAAHLFSGGYLREGGLSERDLELLKTIADRLAAESPSNRL